MVMQIFKLMNLVKNLGIRNLAIPAFNMSMESQITKLAWLLGKGIEYPNLKEYFHADFKGKIDVLKELKQ